MMFAAFGRPRSYAVAASTRARRFKRPAGTSRGRWASGARSTSAMAHSRRSGDKPPPRKRATSSKDAGAPQNGGDAAASLTAGFAAMDKVLARTGLTLADIDRIEFMEAFAVTIAKFLRDRDVDPARVNVSGGHLAKGHPMGASGAILTSTLLDALDACGGRYGLVVLTGAMGVGAAMVVERVT